MKACSGRARSFSLLALVRASGILDIVAGSYGGLGLLYEARRIPIIRGRTRAIGIILYMVACIYVDSHGGLGLLSEACRIVVIGGRTRIIDIIFVYCLEMVTAKVIIRAQFDFLLIVVA